MKLLFNFILSITVLMGGAQDTVAIQRISFSVDNLKLVDHSTATSLDGNFAFGDGHENYLYTFYKDGTFKKWESSCMGDYPITKGRYKFLKNFKIKLSEQGEFYIYKLDKFLIFSSHIKR
jgi:hypothetical protein